MNTEDVVYFSSSLKFDNFEVVPRFELITKSIENKRPSYELLCSVLFDGERVSTEDFFSIASVSDVNKIYNYALEKASASGIKRCFINVNATLINSGMIEGLVNDFQGIKLGIELTDKTTLSEFYKILPKLLHFRESLGLSIYLDDFGLSGLNFELINNFRFDGVKIPRATVDVFDSDMLTLKWLIQYLKTKTNNIVIEGVDNVERYLFCKSEDALMQGYYIEFLRKWYEYN